MHVAKDLESLMTRDERDDIEVTLVTNENYMVFQPLLPEVISRTIETLHCITPIRRLARRTQIYTRPIEAIDLVNKTVQLGGEFQPKLLTLHYDQLVIGLGTRLNYKLVPGMREHATPFKYLGDALRLRNETVGMLEEADIETDPVEKKKLLTFVVAGGASRGSSASPSSTTSSRPPSRRTSTSTIPRSAASSCRVPIGSSPSWTRGSPATPTRSSRSVASRSGSTPVSRQSRPTPSSSRPRGARSRSRSRPGLS